jgi:hypothetical protein
MHNFCGDLRDACNNPDVRGVLAGETMASAQKKVVIRCCGGTLAWGYLPQTRFVVAGRVELIEVDARAKLIDLNEIETIAYVRDFNLDDTLEPERMGRRAFPARPKVVGLWVRVEFLRDLAPLEGVLSFDLSALDSLLEDRGIFLVPPDGRSNTLRVFIPRTALRTLEVVGWVSSPSKRLADKAAKQLERAKQAGLFEE